MAIRSSYSAEYADLGGRAGAGRSRLGAQAASGEWAGGPDERAGFRILESGRGSELADARRGGPPGPLKLNLAPAVQAPRFAGGICTFTHAQWLPVGYVCLRRPMAYPGPQLELLSDMSLHDDARKCHASRLNVGAEHTVTGWTARHLGQLLTRIRWPTRRPAPVGPRTSDIAVGMLRSARAGYFRMISRQVRPVVKMGCTIQRTCNGVLTSHCAKDTVARPARRMPSSSPD
jgi:hypothetical protein